MNIFDIIKTRRTIRKFDNEKKINKSNLLKMVQLWVLYPSRMNKQPLEFIIIDDKELCKKIFSKILWWIKNKTNKVFADPVYAPNAYIAILHNKTILEKWFEYDIWWSAENIMIFANSLWIWSVWLHSILKIEISNLLNIPKDTYNLDSLIWLGYPHQTSETVKLDGDKTSYYIDDEHNLYVPKRDFNSIAHNNIYWKWII